MTIDSTGGGVAGSGVAVGAGGTRVCAVVLGAASLALAAFMAMHPTPHAHDLEGLVKGLEEGAGFNGFVHGTLTGLLGVVFVCLWTLVDVLGAGRLLVRGGLVAYGAGAMSMGGAALINGFILPGLASRHGAADTTYIEKLRPLVAICQEANTTLAQGGVIAASVAVVLWSVAMLRKETFAPVPGIIGLLAGIVPVAALAGGRLPMSVHGFGGFLLLQVVWYLGVAVWLFRLRR